MHARHQDEGDGDVHWHQIVYQGSGRTVSSIVQLRSKFAQGISVDIHGLHFAVQKASMMLARHCQRHGSCTVALTQSALLCALLQGHCAAVTVVTVPHAAHAKFLPVCLRLFPSH